MDIQQVIQAAAKDPRFQSALQAAQAELSDASPEQIDELIKLFELMLKRPQDYAQILAAAVQDDMVEAGDLPEQFDATTIASLLVVLYKLREGGGEQAMFARGGLAGMRTLARQGRLGDTMLAHISPEEAAMLKAHGGAGTINPRTGLPQFFSLKQLVAVALPIAINFIAPGLGTAIGTAMGATGTAATMLGSAVIGGVSAGLTGGDPLKGAVLGGLGGGLGSTVGGAANSALGLGLGEAGSSILGGALVGGAMGAATGQGFGKGALMGAAGAGLGSVTQGVGEGALGAGIGSAGQYAGNMLTAGFSPKEAVMGGALSGLATGLTYGGPSLKPSQAVVDEMREMPGGTSKMLSEFKPGEQAINPETGQAYMPGGQQGPAAKPGFFEQAFGKAPAPTEVASGTGLQEPPVAGSGMSPLKTAATMAVLGSLTGSRPQAVNQAISTLSPTQQEYFNRPSVKWDWDKLQNDANANNMSLSQYMASYWPQITSGTYNMPLEQPKLARGGMYAMGGGPLGAVARLARGAGSGRDDTIDARLSDGEYVMDAETVAMLGDGSTEAGARRLDEMRAQLRKHKGKVLAKGKFSPNAKSPLAYLKGAA